MFPTPRTRTVPSSPSTRLADAARTLVGDGIPLRVLAATLGTADLIRPFATDEDLLVAAVLRPLGVDAAVPFGDAVVGVVGELRGLGLDVHRGPGADAPSGAAGAWTSQRRDELARLAALVARHRPAALVALGAAVVHARQPTLSDDEMCLWLAGQRLRVLSVSSTLPRDLVADLERHVLLHTALLEDRDPFRR